MSATPAPMNPTLALVAPEEAHPMLVRAELAGAAVLEEAAVPAGRAARAALGEVAAMVVPVEAEVLGEAAATAGLVGVVEAGVLEGAVAEPMKSRVIRRLLAVPPPIWVRCAGIRARTSSPGRELPPSGSASMSARPIAVFSLWTLCPCGFA